ncbi:MAG: hypothetical protein ACTSQG_06350 [Promethearchaeota archaeon]
MKRNKKYIKDYLKEIEEIWNENNELRFGQLIMNLGDVYYMEDEILLSGLECIYARADLLLLDYERKGNVLKLYFGHDKECWGDDWDDIPYEHNAGLVYEQFVIKTEELYIPFKYRIVEPSEFYDNSPFCKADFKKREVPLFVIIEDSKCYETFEEYVKDGISIYMFDTIDRIFRGIFYYRTSL